MDTFPASMPHGTIETIFPGVYFVTGTFEGEFFGSMWQFGRNMTIVQDGEDLTLVNAVRLNDEGLAALEALGTITNVVRIGSMHGYDDAFYVDRYSATYWALQNMPHAEGLSVDRDLVVGGQMPFSDCSLFAFETTKLPEGILRLDREGGILIACDSLQNWVKPDDFTRKETAETMAQMGFYQPANLGPAWMQANEPGAADFQRLSRLSYKHVLCGHGEPLLDTAQRDFAATFNRVFGV